MATRRVVPDGSSRRVWVQPLPVKRKKRFRRVRRLLQIVLALALVSLVAWIYILLVYAPGLRVEARSVPLRVHNQLDQQGASYVQLAQISPDIQQAIVAIEDRRFYQHPGIDPLGMVRALWVDLTNQHVDQGGSTLEQQLVKRSIVYDDRTLRAKLRTVGLAWAVDQEFSKGQVLELYLNAAYFGRGAYGVGAAARIYFGTDAAHLTLGQAAFLAALPQAPSIFGANPSGPGIRQRWLTVLQDMQNSGDISAQQVADAERTPLGFAFPNP